MTRRIALALLAATAVVACETNNPTPAPSGVAVNPSPGVSGEPAPSDAAPSFEILDGPPPMPFPGLYITENLSFTGDELAVIVRSANTCALLAHLVEAGEWRVAGSADTGPDEEYGSPAMTILALERDGDAGRESAVAWLSGGENCSARVVRTFSGHLSVSGAATFDAEAPYDEGTCITIDTGVALGVVYRTPNGPTVQLGVLAPARLGLSSIAADDVDVHVGRGAMSIGQLASTVIGAFKDPEKGGFLAEAFEAGGIGRASIDVTSISPFEGTVTITDFEGAKGRIDIEAEISCHLPGSALRRAAEALAGPGGTIAPATPGPTLGSVGGAAPGTAVITGGPLDGTYEIPPGELYCVRDDETGDWVATSVGQTSLYVLARTPAGGGETDTAIVGMVSGDGTTEATIDSTLTPPEGAAHVKVTVSGNTISFVLTGRTPEGWSVAADLSCPRSE